MMSVDIMLNSEITHLSKMLTDTSRGEKGEISPRGFVGPERDQRPSGAAVQGAEGVPSPGCLRAEQGPDDGPGHQ